jgi:hypothetical protein
MDELVSDGDGGKSSSGKDNRGRKRDSIVNLEHGREASHEGTSKPAFECNGGIESDAKWRVDCHPGTDHRNWC